MQERVKNSSRVERVQSATLPHLRRLDLVFHKQVI